MSVPTNLDSSKNEKPFTTVVVSEEGAAIRLERVVLTDKAKRALSVDRALWDAATAPRGDKNGKD